MAATHADTSTPEAGSKKLYPAMVMVWYAQT